MNDCIQNVIGTVSLMSSIGFLINEKKSVLVPSTKIVHFGFVIDSNFMIVMLPDEKKENLAEKSRTLYDQNKATIRHVVQIIDALVAAFPAVDFGKLHCRNFEKAKYSALKKKQLKF